MLAFSNSVGGKEYVICECVGIKEQVHSMNSSTISGVPWIVEQLGEFMCEDNRCVGKEQGWQLDSVVMVDFIYTNVCIHIHRQMLPRILALRRFCCCCCYCPKKWTLTVVSEVERKGLQNLVTLNQSSLHLHPLPHVADFRTCLADLPAKSSHCKIWRFL